MNNRDVRIRIEVHRFNIFNVKKVEQLLSLLQPKLPMHVEGLQDCNEMFCLYE